MAPIVIKTRNPGRACPGCGTTLIGLIRKFRAGCARCYETFPREIELILTRDSSGNGKMHYTGKRPGHVKSISDHIRMGEIIRDQISEALTHEDYEQASRLQRNLEDLPNG